MPGHLRLGRARGIVDPGVHDPGVVTRLVRGDGRFLLEDHHVDACRRETAGHREPDDAGPDNADGLRRTVHHANRTVEDLILSPNFALAAIDTSPRDPR